MKIYIDESSFKPWSEAIKTYEYLEKEGRLEDFWAMMEEIYPEGLSETDVNDILWFEDEWIYESLGMRNPYADEDEEDDEYDEFCGKYTCDTCPLKDAEDCEEAFEKLEVFGK